MVALIWYDKLYGGDDHLFGGADDDLLDGGKGRDNAWLQVRPVDMGGSERALGGAAGVEHICSQAG